MFTQNSFQVGNCLDFVINPANLEFLFLASVVLLAFLQKSLYNIILNYQTVFSVAQPDNLLSLDDEYL